MSHLPAHVHLFCFLLLSNVPVRQFVPPTDGTPIIQKGAAFIYNYQAVTSESESKVRIFSPFPQPPPVDLTAVDSLIDLVSNIHYKLTSLPFLETVASDEPCPIAMYTSQDRANGLRESIEYCVHLLADERSAIAQDYAELLRVASSFAPPPMEPPSIGTPHHRQRRLVPALMAASGVAGLVLGNPIRNAACKAFSIFSLCSDNSALKKNVRNLLQRQATFEKSLHRVQQANDEKFFLLGTEIADTQKSFEALRDVIDARLNATGEAICQLDSRLIIMSNCMSIQRQFEIIVDKVHNYTSYLDLAYMHLKSYRASFVSYKTSMYSAVSSFSSGFVPPNFLTPDQLAAIVEDLTAEEIRRGTMLTPAIQFGFEATYYEVQIVLEVTVLQEGLSIVSGIPMNSKSSTFDVYRAIPLHQPNEDGTTASVYRFSHEFVAIATDNSQYAELSATTLNQCSGTNRIKFCRKGFSTTTDETLLCLTSLFYEYSITALRNCLMDSVLLPEAPQASYLADGLYHVISRTARLQVKNDTDGLPVSISTLQCQACLIRPSCSSTLTFNHGDLVLTPDMDFCETRPEPFVASVKLTPSLAAVFNTLPPASADLNVYSFGEDRREIVSSVQLELAALPHVKTMTNQDLRTVAQPISHYYTTISPSTSGALADYMPMRTAFSLACVSMTISLLSFSISFTVFRRQWQRFFKHPQRFFRGTHGRFLHIVPSLNDDDNDLTTAFLYMTDAEFLAIKGLAREVHARSATEITSCVPPPNPLYPDKTHVYTSAT